MRDSAGSAVPGLPDPAEGPASDELLLAAVRAGDSAAFGELFERHRGAALAVARMHSRGEADAQDLVSEAFTRVLALLREGRGPREFLRAYLVTAVSRLAADRANDLSRTRPEEPRPDGPLDQVQLFDDTVVRQVDSAVVSRAFASLPERWQEVLWYLEVEGRRPRQVAAVVGMQPNAVSALGKRAREGLRTAYMQEHVSARALEDCHQFSSQLGGFVRGSLTPSRTKVVQDHLDTCCRCTAEYLQLQDLGLGMRGWLLPVLAGLPLWEGAGGRLTEVLGGLPLTGGGAGGPAGVHDVAGSAGHATSGPAPGGSNGAKASGGSGAAGWAVGLAGSGTASAAAVVALAVVAATAVGYTALHGSSEDPAPEAVATQSVGADGQGSDRAASSAAATPGAQGADAGSPQHDAAPSGGAAPGGGMAADPGAAAAGEGAEPGSGADTHASGPEEAVPSAPFLPGTAPEWTLPRELPEPAASVPVSVPTVPTVPPASPPPEVVTPSPQTSPGEPGGGSAPAPSGTGPPVPSEPQPSHPAPSEDPCDWIIGSVILPLCPPWAP
ncbi:sigma-70 family RNA polymerase sigma factor [Kocuria tytonicola]|nr:sigma-70 family RNA polymerase sigma factor [Kocuria tytonicola]